MLLAALVHLLGIRHADIVTLTFDRIIVQGPTMCCVGATLPSNFNGITILSLVMAHFVPELY